MIATILTTFIIMSLIHMTNKIIHPLKEKKYSSQIGNYKPTGLWYSIGDTWEEFIQWKYQYKYEVILQQDCYTVNIDEVNPLKILQISPLTMKQFHDKYKINMELSGSNVLSFIDWNIVQEKYGGIEFVEYDNTSFMGNFEYLWFLTIDISSGCIWNLKLIKEIICLS